METIFNGAVNDYTTNGLNQYTASDGTTYDYDADGNLVSVTQDGATTTYTYNSQNGDAHGQSSRSAQTTSRQLLANTAQKARRMDLRPLQHVVPPARWFPAGGSCI